MKAEKTSYRFSLRKLFFFMTTMAILATIVVYALKLPSNLQEVLFFLAILSGFLLIGALGSSLMIHPIGSLLVYLVSGSYFAVLAFQYLLNVQEIGYSLLSWKSLLGTVYLAASAGCYFYACVNFRVYRGRNGEIGKE